MFLFLESSSWHCIFKLYITPLSCITGKNTSSKDTSAHPLLLLQQASSLLSPPNEFKELRYLSTLHAKTDSRLQVGQNRQKSTHPIYQKHPPEKKKKSRNNWMSFFSLSILTLNTIWFQRGRCTASTGVITVYFLSVISKICVDAV